MTSTLTSDHADPITLDTGGFDATLTMSSTGTAAGGVIGATGAESSLPTSGTILGGSAPPAQPVCHF